MKTKSVRVVRYLARLNDFPSLLALNDRKCILTYVELLFVPCVPPFPPLGFGSVLLPSRVQISIVHNKNESTPQTLAMYKCHDNVSKELSIGNISLELREPVRMARYLARLHNLPPLSCSPWPQLYPHYLGLLLLPCVPLSPSLGFGSVFFCPV